MGRTKKSNDIRDDAVFQMKHGTAFLAKSNLFTISDLLNEVKKVLLAAEDNAYTTQFLSDGVEANMLAPGSLWKTGKIKLKIEFIPDIDNEEDLEDEMQIEDNLSKEPSQSSLDDLRRILS